MCQFPLWRCARPVILMPLCQMTCAWFVHRVCITCGCDLFAVNGPILTGRTPCARVTTLGRFATPGALTLAAPIHALHLAQPARRALKFKGAFALNIQHFRLRRRRADKPDLALVKRVHKRHKALRFVEV